MMKVLLLCNSDVLALPAALKLEQEGMLSAIVVPESNANQLLIMAQQIGIGIDKVHAVTKKNLHPELKELIARYTPDVLFTMTFSWNIPAGILNLPSLGCYNFHFGLLPKYKGADPIFWQIKNMEKYGGISVHVMTEDIDSGPIVLREELAIIPGETYGLYAQRLAALAAEKVAIVPDMLKAGTLTIEQKADEPALFYKAPSPTDLRINWQEQNAGEIENLVNATNPRYGGAFTSIRQSQVNLLEVAPADINNPTGEQIAPGTIVHADVMYGLIVACTNHQFLKINVVHVQQGYLSGSKMFNLGFRAGEVFV